ncbi:hypothetical protein EKQ61_01475 [Staphylococcus gallinarum]|uniref:Phage protein n=1 Tax=Staphylococcus gallinarum TaxID=1293 RepID=A0A380FF56_STAGA|nr:hypothetical protein [Staphylococcus gallinarum]RTX82864.1 hypothetical protein EKQ61_01475 [Staphylococcus gallinarum]GEQ04548.1 hypothetical protein SGA02_03760 [Staphylococcus gallinarum]SUM32103.1 phage protein [Staphylococcus gallinarum]
MSEPTKEELLAFMRKHGPEKVDSITDTESAIRHFRCTSKIYKEQRDQYKAERDTLIDDIAVLRANNKRLERENNDLRLQADTYFDEWQNIKNLYKALTQHIRQKAENNPNVDRYIALINYMNRLEGGEDER